MDVSEDSIKWFGDRITDLIRGNDLSRETAKEMMKQTLMNSQPDLQQGAFLAALRMKGETEDEIVGCFEAIMEADTISVDMGESPVVENCGTGMDSIKTFNISTLSAIVAACLDVPVARHGSRAISSRCGTVDLCESFGIDVECDVNIISKSIEKCGLGLFNGASPQVHPVGLGRILSRIRFGTTLNIAASLANPALPKIGVRGVGDPEQIEPTVKVMKRIGYRKGMVFHGFNKERSAGMDELSTIGASRIACFNDKGETEYMEIHPDDVGLPKGNYDEMQPDFCREKEACRAINLLAGRGGESRSNIVALNAGAIIWMAGKADSLKEGVAAASAVIDQGKALKRLALWAAAQNRRPDSGNERIKSLFQKSGVSQLS